MECIAERTMERILESSHKQIAGLVHLGLTQLLQGKQLAFVAEVKMHYNRQGCRMEHNLGSKVPGRRTLVGEVASGAVLEEEEAVESSIVEYTLVHIEMDIP